MESSSTLASSSISAALAFDVQWWYYKIVLVLREHSRCGSVVLAAWDFIVLLLFPHFLFSSLPRNSILQIPFLFKLEWERLYFFRNLPNGNLQMNIT